MLLSGCIPYLCAGSVGWKRSCVCLLWQRKTCLYIWSVGLRNQHGGVVFSGNLNEHNENGIHPPNLISLIHKVYFHTQNVVFTSDWRSWRSSCMGWGSVNVFVSPCGVFVVTLLFLTSLCVFMFVHTLRCVPHCRLPHLPFISRHQLQQVFSQLLSLFPTSTLCKKCSLT